jgi:hypothetical protein
VLEQPQGEGRLLDRDHRRRVLAQLVGRDLRLDGDELDPEHARDARVGQRRADLLGEGLEGDGAPAPGVRHADAARRDLQPGVARRAAQAVGDAPDEPIDGGLVVRHRQRHVDGLPDGGSAGVEAALGARQRVEADAGVEALEPPRDVGRLHGDQAALEPVAVDLLKPRGGLVDRQPRDVGSRRADGGGDALAGQRLLGPGGNGHDDRRQQAAQGDDPPF